MRPAMRCCIAAALIALARGAVIAQGIRDAERFPEDTFGKIYPWWLQTKENSTQRYVNIGKAFSAFGAAQDPDYEPAFYNKSI